MTTQQTTKLTAAVRSLVPLTVCLALGLLVLAGVIAVAGASPTLVAQTLFVGAFGTRYNIAETLLQTTPLILTGLSVALAFRCRLFNIGAEGQFLVGAIAAVWVGTAGAAVVPKPLLLPAALAVGALAGALWAGIAAVLKLARGVQEVLSTLLLNFVALQLVAFMVRGPLQEAAKGFPQSDSIATAARLAFLLPQTRLHAGLLLALALAFVVWFYLSATVGGFQLRAVGAGAPAAEASGISINKTVAATFLLSGALAGLAGAVQMCGATYYLSDGYSRGYGYTAIAVALLANLSPLGVLPSALFFGALTAGANVVQQRVPGISAVVVQVLQAVTLFALLGYAWARERQRQQQSGESATAAKETTSSEIVRKTDPTP